MMDSFCKDKIMKCAPADNDFEKTLLLIEFPYSIVYEYKYFC